jgi:hypothetical protein
MTGTEHTDPPGPRRAGTRRGRWALWVLPAIPVAALVLAVLYGPYLALRIAPIRERALDSGAVRRVLGERLRVRIGAVNQLGLQGADLGGVTVEVRDSTGTWQMLGEIGRLSVRWSPWRQLSGETLIYTLEAGPITLRREALPLAFGGPQKPPSTERDRALRLPLNALLPPGLPRVEVRHILLGPIEVREGERVILRVGLERGELVADAGELRLRPRDAWVELPERGMELRVSDADVRVTRELAQVQKLAFSGSTAEGELSARYVPGTDGPPLEGELTLTRLDPGVVTRWLVPGVIPGPNDTVKGKVGFQLGTSPAVIDVALEGMLLGESCSRCSGTVRIAGQEFSFADVELRAEACELAAHGRWDGATRRATIAARWSRFNPTSAWLPWIRALSAHGSFPGEAELAIELPVGQAPLIEGSVDVRDARPLGIQIDRARLSGRFIPDDAITADELQVDLGGGHITGAGRYPLREGEVEGSVTVDSVDLESLPPEWVRGAAGRLWGQFQVSGVPGDPLLEGSARASELRYGAWSAQHAAIGSLLLWPKDLRGSGTVSLNEVRNGNGVPADLDVGFSRWQEGISLAADLHRTDADVHVEGRIDPAGRAQIDAGQATLRRGGHWELAAPLGITWGQGRVAADSLRLTSNGTHLIAAGEWRAPSRELKLGIRLEGYRLERLHEILGKSGLDLKGTGAVRIDAAGRLPDPRLQVEVHADDVVVGGLDLGRVELAAVWEDGALAVDRGQVTSAALSASLRELHARPGATLMELLGLAPTEGEGAVPRKPALDLLRQTQWEANIEVERLDLATWAPLFGMPHMHADADRGRAVIHTVGGREVPIYVNAPWDIAPAAAGVGGMGGTWRGTLALGGTLAEPRMRVVGAAEDLSWGGLPAGSLALDLRYENSLLTVSDLALTSGVNFNRVSGYYPLRVEFLPFQVARTDWPASVQATFTNLNVGLFSPFIPWLTDVQGDLSGALVVSGTGTVPELAGSLYLRRGGFRVPGRSERIFDVEADMRLGADGLRVVSLTGRSGPQGTMRAEGIIKSPEEFNLLARAEHMRVFEQGVYSFEARAESLRVYSRRGEESPPVPRIHGHVTVLNGYLRLQLEPEAAAAAAVAAGRGEPIPWEIALDVAVPGTVQVSQATSKVDVGEGELRLTFHWPIWSASGSLKILGGTYRVLNNNFQIVEGTLDLRDSGAGFEPRVDVTGETHVVVADPEVQSGSTTVTVEVHVSGKPEELQIDLTSKPAYSPEQITELLTYRRLTGTGRLGAETEGMLVSEAVARIEASLAEQIPTSTTVNIETSGESGEAWVPRRVRLQQMITPELTGDYTQEFYRGTDWEVYVQYRLSRLFSLRTGMKHVRDKSQGLIEEYSADLRWWFEYE